MVKKIKEGKKYWYHTETYECVLCGWREVTKERRYTKKPKEYSERNFFHQNMCDCLIVNKDCDLKSFE